METRAQARARARPRYEVSTLNATRTRRRTAPAGQGEQEAIAASGWPIRCPRCKRALGHLPLDGAASEPGTGPTCATDGWRLRLDAGVWRGPAGSLGERLEQFVEEYAQVRHAEGRGEGGRAAVQRLPFARTGDPMAAAWAVRARSYRHLDRRLLQQLPAGSRILDIGAGNGWLSRRLALAGHRVLAVDVTVDPHDGLHAAAAAAPPARYARLEADFDDLPLAAGSADVVIFNAALHYSPDPARTLTRASGVVRPGGRLVVVDSPFYAHSSHGRRMVAERREAYLQRYGFASDALGSREFLVARDLVDGEVGGMVRWRRSRPWLGWRMAMRPLKAHVRRRRPPAVFPLWIGRRVV